MGIPIQSSQPIRLAKEVSTASVLLLGIGALLGGGIFTLLGPSISYAGAAVLIALGLNAFVSFLNLQMYVSFATTLPEAGGGNRWVKMGLGDFQGFIAGWISWLAHGAACGLYALSGGFYFSQLLFFTMGFSVPFGFSPEAFMKIFAIFFLLVFGWLNWRSNKSTQHTGAVIVIILLAILGLFIVSGFFGLTDKNGLVANVFSNFWAQGFVGIMSAAALFYIAFEGSEIQAQSGEEVKNPKTLKTALFGAWGVVSFIYFLVAFIMLSHGPFSGLGEGAIIETARRFMPLGMLLMIIGGILANIAALNATIFSSSRLAFSLARDRSILHQLSHIHFRNFTPDWAVVASVAIIGVMILALPLVSVGAAASLLFIILFLQLNIAGIAIRRQNPEIKWNYHIRGYPVTTVIAIIMYIVLAIAMMFVVSAAWLVTIIWLLLGAVNYFAYTKHQRQETFQQEILYEQTLRLGVKKTHRILLPINENVTSGELAKMARFAFTFASYWQSEIIAVTIHTRPHPKIEHERQMIDRIVALADEYNHSHPAAKIAIHTYILASSDIVETILEIIRQEDCDLLILNWDGYVRSKGKIFGSKIDPVLRKAECDLAVLKTDAGEMPQSILFVVDRQFKNPSLRFTGKIASALALALGSRLTIFIVVSPKFKVLPEYEQWKNELEFKINNKIKLDESIPYKIKICEDKSIAAAVLKESVYHDLVVMGASKVKPFAEIRIGNIPEFIIKHIKKPLLVVKGHRSIAQPLIDYIKERMGV